MTGPSASGSEKGKPELDEVGTGRDGRLGQRGSLGTAHEVDDECLGTIRRSCVTHQ